jgi:parallel beta-helix repeat protein
VAAVVSWSLVGASSAASTPSHAPIVIASDGDFQSCNCVVSGHGTMSDPFVIGPWSINNINGTAVSIDGTSLTKSFVLSNLTIAGNQTAADTGIVLNHINMGGSAIVAQVSGAQTSIQTNNVGILVENSSNVTLDGGAASSSGPGAKPGGGVINRNSDGAIDLEHATNITVQGWQMNANGGDHEPDWLGLDPSSWGVGGVRMFGVTGSTVDHNSANNDTDVSYSVLDSSHNTISNNTANYPFTMNVLVTDGSSYNTVAGNAFSTGDFIGILVADPLPGYGTLESYGASHDNHIQGNSDHSDGPTGTELSPIDIAPAFLGGIAVLNGTYNNTITGNNIWSSAGGDLVWAQAVPDSGSAIGVVTYPPTLHCNVTLSNGGGGVTQHNGNTWTGNTVKLHKNIDLCIPTQ